MVCLPPSMRDKARGAEYTSARKLAVHACVCVFVWFRAVNEVGRGRTSVYPAALL